MILQANYVIYVRSLNVFLVGLFIKNYKVEIYYVYNEFGKFKFDLPICPSNMNTVVDFNVAKKLAENKLFYIMHYIRK